MQQQPNVTAKTKHNNLAYYIASVLEWFWCVIPPAVCPSRWIVGSCHKMMALTTMNWGILPYIIQNISPSQIHQLQGTLTL
jgi:hypothetical protein